MEFRILTTFFIFLSVSLHGQGKSAVLWKIESKDSKDASYLLGTIHSRDKRVFNLDSSLVSLLSKADIYVPEVDLSGGFTDEMRGKLILPDGKTLKDLYSKDEYDLITREFEKRSSKTIEEVHRFQPSFILTFQEKSSPYFLPLMLDEYLYNLAKDMGKKIHGLESVNEQISALIESQDIRYLYNYFKNTRVVDSLYDKLLQAYIAEDEKTLLALGTDTRFSGYDAKILTDRRNEVMTARMDSIMRRQTAFFALGAGHLFGNGGVVNRLKNLGYIVTPVRNRKKMYQTISYNIAWQDYQSVNNNFKIKFPDKPEVRKETQETIYTADFLNQGSPVIMFSVVEKISPDFTRIDTESMVKMALFAVQSSFSKALNCTVRSTKFIKHNGSHALETLFSTDETGMLTHARFILVHDRLYLLTALVRPNLEDLESIHEFMNSFLILK
jgi:uncharacterized protein YbaP (TraB family)